MDQMISNKNNKNNQTNICKVNENFTWNNWTMSGLKLETKVSNEHSNILYFVRHKRENIEVKVANGVVALKKKCEKKCAIFYILSEYSTTVLTVCSYLT